MSFSRLASKLFTLEIVVAVLLAVPTLLVRMPPMVDFPAHEAVVGVLARWGDPAYLAGELYHLNIGHPNQLQYAIALPFAWLFGPTKGLEVSVAVAVALVILGAARLAEHLGRPRWIALCVAPVAIGWNYQWGHIANLLGIGVLLYVLPSLDRFVRAPTWRGVGSSCGLMILLYFAHEASMVLACVAVSFFALRPWSTRRALMSAIPCALAVVVFFVQLRVQNLTLVNQVFFLVPVPLHVRIFFVPGVIVGYPSDAVTVNISALLCALPVMLGAVLQVRSRWSRAGSDSGGLSEQQVRTAPYWGLFGLLVLGYLFLPLSYGGVFYLSHRCLPIAWALLVVLAFGPGEAHPRALRLGAIAVPVGLALVYFPAFYASDEVYRELDELLPNLQGSSAVLTIELDKVARGAVAQAGYSTRNAHGHVMALKGGRSLHDYTQSPISPAFMRDDEKRWEIITGAAFSDPVAIHPAAALTHFRYFAVHSVSPELHAATAYVLDEVATPVALSPQWSIFESKILEVKVTDGEGTYPKNKGITLRTAIGTAFQEMRSMPQP